MNGSAPAAVARVGKVRWLMVFLVFAVAAVSYLDRANISIAAPHIKTDLGLSDRQLGMVFSAFVFGYAFTQPFAGRLADRFGPYKVIAVGILWWSVLTSATALIPAGYANALGLMLAVRFILGVGEAVIFPAGNRLVASWIPSQERGLANGLIFAGVGIGAGIAPPLITRVMLAHDWRTAFQITAVIGLVALVAWMLMAREKPTGHPWVKPAELAYIASDEVTQAAVDSPRLASWGSIILNKQVALLTLSYFCFGYVAWIFFTWFFTYLSQVRGLDLKSSGIYGMLPFIAMALASPAGGWISDRLCPRFGKRIGRCAPAVIGMALTAVFVTIATQVADARLAAVVLALGSGSLYLSQSAFWTISADIGRSSAGSVSGVMNMGSQLGGATVAAITPILAESLGWSGSFLVAAAAAVVGAIGWMFIDPTAALTDSRSKKTVVETATA
ncbi:MFS transporter [Phenylobacterium hankyongense]|uniref:MFS transporter n=1 Tax=Phenylobacterium hankyongense TaxID=1813876 RepID=A0A328AZN8_9CAUL|nr:MFS transporter [Phenylobacterium hankyongense]RAK60393.1 MFS transporter [Phenylobacterium hankyongense]